MFATGDFIEMPLITGVIFLMAGVITYLFPPKKNQFFLWLPHFKVDAKSRKLDFRAKIFKHKNDSN